MPTQQQDVVIRAWARLMKAQRIAMASVQRALKQADLPPLEWYDVLLELERAGAPGLRPFELERNLLLAQYNLSRLVDRMAKAGCVARQACEEDARGQVLVITEAGRELRRRMWLVYGPAITHAIADRLSPAEVALLDTTLGTLIKQSQAA